jgi:hypothetical protein
MKRIMIFFSLIILSQIIHAQACQDNTIQPVAIINGITYWYGISVKDVMDNTDLIFEGLILDDSMYFQNSPGRYYTYHRVLVQKQFKGIFQSDTIKVVSLGGSGLYNGEWSKTPGSYAFKGDEAVFFVSVMKLGNNDPDLYYMEIKLVTKRSATKKMW